eukprot:gb/GFBE01073464.1/.p1 GENE.gb/GFBE01073464.1/~~gb/GFBE01073464.1/.p1  ORF type:complete len:193 (+),score=57.01 gb/GFBE01073464.1/:1-579(+)
MARLLLAAALLAAPGAAYVVPTPGNAAAQLPRGQSPVFGAEQLEIEELVVEPEATAAFGVLAAGFGVGAVLGWLNSRKQQVASVAAAAAMTVAPVAANAMVDYEGVEYLGGSDKVDINNANVQAYRQFPGMFPTAAGVIGTHGPYKQVSDIYNIPGLDERIKNTIKKYENNLVCLPANPAYFIDRINNGLYR